jgi:hypothetical protein
MQYKCECTSRWELTLLHPYGWFTPEQLIPFDTKYCKTCGAMWVDPSHENFMHDLRQMNRC